MNLQALNDFHLLRPFWLLALPALAGFLWWLAKRTPEAGNWQRACDAALLPWLLTGADQRRSRSALWLIGFAATIAILALSGPVWKKLEQPVFRTQSALVIALDLSRSMDATDLAPSRMVQAQHKLSDILERRREGHTALLVFAAQPFVVSPLTDDAETILAQINSLNPEIMPAQGGRVDLALAKGAELLAQAGIGRGDLLLITDGINPGDWINKLPKKSKVRISVLGVGTEQGAPIPTRGGGFLKDSEGAIVLPKLEEAPLRELANRGGGRYARIGVDDRDINWLLAPLDDPALGDEVQQTSLQADQWREEGPWLVIALLPLAALAFRRGVLLLLVVLLAPLPHPAAAAEGFAWPDWLGGENLWQRPDQQGVRSLEQGHASEAAQLFRNPEWEGVAHYQAGEYEQAVNALKGIETARGHYNRGNALARLGRYPEALMAYEEALKLDPDDADAKANRDLIKEQLRKQQQQNQMQPPPEGGDKGENRKSPQQEGAESKSEQQKQDQQGEQPKNADQTQAGQQQPKSDEEGQSEAQQTGEGNPQPDQPPSAEQQAQAQQTEQSPDKEQPPSAEEGVAKAPTPEKQSEEEQSQAEGEAAAPAEQEPLTEEERATEQWLRRIPDDPAGLLRRKFQYQYRQQYRGEAEEQGW